MFRDKTVLITGASSGIGAALARRFARAGAQPLLVARRADRLAALAEELDTRSGKTVWISADLVEAGACERVVREARREAGEIDILINNAGVGEYGRFVEQRSDALERMMALNMGAVVRLTHLVLPAMCDRGTGAIMNIASTAAYQPTPYMAVYGATKAFVLSFSMAIWEEARRRGVGVTCVCPGPVRTEFFDHGGFESRKAAFSRTGHDSEVIAELAYRQLARGRAAYVPGLLNRIGAVLTRFAPLRIATQASARLLRPK
ncbi:MAG: SDR family NAD(P)-dependent oxidoreductase [Phycisphaerae bacterium]